MGLKEYEVKRTNSREIEQKRIVYQVIKKPAYQKGSKNFRKGGNAFSIEEHVGS
jgi:hypothetical protein